MIIAADLTRDGKLLPEAIDSARADAAELGQALAAAADPEQLAAIAIVAGKARLPETLPTLMPLLGKDGLPGKAAAWALGQLAAKGGAAEPALLAAIATGDLDTRENGYQALAVLAARGMASATLADALAQRVQAEIDRAKSGGSGLGEHVCRVLAVLGAPSIGELIQRVIENDRFCDRFELQRLRKAVEDGGRDQETIKALTAPWTTVFADQLFVPAPAKPEAPAVKPAAKPASPLKSAAPPAGSTPAPAAPPAAGDAEGIKPGAEADGADGAEPGVAPAPINWQDFLASPEAATLAAPVKQLAGQLGPMLEQLAARVIRAALADLTGQELVGLLLQVLPQALPPQHVQMALSPQAVNGYQAIAKYLARTGLATNGQELIEAVKMVRKDMINQIRQAGIIGGPDYSDPDDKQPPAVK
jgi:hypothetical protein